MTTDNSIDQPQGAPRDQQQDILHHLLQEPLFNNIKLISKCSTFYSKSSNNQTPGQLRQGQKVHQDLLFDSKHYIKNCTATSPSGETAHPIIKWSKQQQTSAAIIQTTSVEDAQQTEHKSHCHQPPDCPERTKDDGTEPESSDKKERMPFEWSSQPFRISKKF
ncbi:hypothetical protein Nepgr_020357 [Nepenthes gracilis]|uniref:Uncharacterized protein n=1 Tax=Nepenthes gracilis TaxID=150966 RepID=A0AAD3SYW3_NEPGR|nr:hypothetical protein Nepgr_020357 [Nepenthes gracilis]